MRHYFAVILLTACTLTQIGYSANEPVKIIFDTDMGNDVDDAMALAMIHALQSRGECELLAVTITKDNKWAASFVDLVNSFYGRTEIPIGLVHDGKTKDDGKYIMQVASAKDNGKLRYSYDLKPQQNIMDATELLRKTLSAQKDRSVVIVQVGFSTNLARLLETKADKYSPLSGLELTARKVKLLSVMAGSFKQIGEHKRYLEYNVLTDVPSAKKLFDQWPGQIIVSGFEIGIAVPYPPESIQKDYEFVEHHPIKDAYELYCGLSHSRPTWDLTSVLYAVRPERDYFGLSQPGCVTVEDDGFTSFNEMADGKHKYLTLTEKQMIRVIESMVYLCSQPTDN